MKYVIMGNQSGDMDSLASAIALAAAYGKDGIALLNIPKEEVHLRKDLLFILEKFPFQLFFKEDIPRLLNEKLKWILVDHNVLAPGQEKIAPFVERIIDHHKDESSFSGDKTIAQVASTSTLVTEWLLKTHPEALTAQIATLLSAAILLDTSNFTDERKVTERDRVAFSQLENISSPLPYAQLLQKRMEVDPSQPLQLLKKDYKLYEGKAFIYGISSLPKGVALTLENREMWKDALNQMLIENKAALWIVLEWIEQEKWAVFYGATPPLRELIFNVMHTKDSFTFCKLKEPFARKVFQPLLNL